MKQDKIAIPSRETMAGDFIYFMDVGAVPYLCLCTTCMQ